MTEMDVNRLLARVYMMPYAYPWEKHTKFNSAEVDKILEKYNLETETKRRKATYFANTQIYIEACKASSIKDIKNRLLKKELPIHVNENIIDKLMNLLGFKNENDLVDFKAFINKDNVKVLKVKSSYKLATWMVDFCVNLLADDVRLSKEFIRRASRFKSRDIFKGLVIPDKTIKEVIFNKSFAKENYSSLIKEIDRTEFKSLFNKFLNIEEVKSHENIVEVMELINNKSTTDIITGVNSEGKDSEDIFDSIVNLFDEVVEIDDEGDICLNEFSVENTSSSVIGDVVSEDISITKENKDIDEIKEKDSLDKIEISKEKYEAMVNMSSSSEVKFLKKLLNLKDGAVLSELYNTYKNIKNESIANIEAVLSNFFSTLSVYGLEVIKTNENIGDDVTVNTKNILKEFVFTWPVNKDGDIEGTVEYYGWSYNGKQIVPMVVKPKEEVK